MKKILVTGAGGFVGSRVMQQWAGHYELCTFPKGFLATAGEDAVRQAVLQPVSYTHLRAHETGRNLVCRLLLEKKK